MLVLMKGGRNWSSLFGIFGIWGVHPVLSGHFLYFIGVFGMVCCMKTCHFGVYSFLVVDLVFLGCIWFSRAVIGVFGVCFWYFATCFCPLA